MISDMQSTAARAQLAELLKYATIIVSSLPLLVMYPFFQKYFDAGIMVGSVKGEERLLRQDALRDSAVKTIKQCSKLQSE